MPAKPELTARRTRSIRPPATAGALVDPFGRRISYLRLSVTDRCDLRCSDYLPKGFEEPTLSLTFTEIERVVVACTRLGAQHVAPTGGEPLVRPNLPELAQRLPALPGLSGACPTCPCPTIVRPEALAVPLYRAGVRRLNASLDSLPPAVFAQMTGGSLARVLAGIAAAPGPALRPDPGGLASGGPARTDRRGGRDICSGFITPLSQHFCATCNRVRLAVDGTLSLCLGHENSLASTGGCGAVVGALHPWAGVLVFTAIRAAAHMTKAVRR